MGRLKVFALATGLLMGWAATGCHVHADCPAIGWSNEVIIAVNGNVDGVALLELCVDGSCVRSEPIMPQAAPAVSPHAQELPSFNPFSRINERSWSASTAMSTPQTVTVRALSAAGQVLAEENAPVQWRRVGGTQECGGPSEAGPVTLNVQS